MLLRHAVALCAWGALVAGIVTLLAFPEAASALQYERTAVQAGQVWRLAAAALTHVSPAHAALNLCAAAGLAASFGRLRATDVAGLLGAGAAVFTAEHLLLHHDWARGLSGPLHAYAAFLVSRAGAPTALRAALGAGLAAKLAYEAVLGPASAGLIGAQVLTSHHLLGAALGGLAAWVAWAWPAGRVGNAPRTGSDLRGAERANKP